MQDLRERLTVQLKKIKEIIQSETSKALLLTESMLEDALLLKDEKILAEVYYNLGVIGIYQGKYHHAYSNLMKAIEIYKKNPDENYIRAMGYLGNLYVALGEYERALYNYDVAQDMIQELNIHNPKLDMGFLNNKGEAYRHLEDYEKAVNYYFEALEFSEEQGIAQGEIYANLNLGLCYEVLNDRKKAYDYASKAALQAQMEDEIVVLPEIYFLMVTLLEEAENTENLRNICEEGIVFCKQTGEIEFRDKFYRRLIDMDMAEKNYEGAKAYLEEMQLFFQQENICEESYILKMNAEIAEAQGDFQQAIEYYKEAYQKKKAEDHKHNQDELSTLMEKYEIEQEENQKEIERIKNVTLKEKNNELREKSKAFNKVLNQLSLIEDIGQYITSTFDFEEIFTSVYIYLHDLLDIEFFAVGTIDKEKKEIQYFALIEENQRMPGHVTKLDDEDSLAVWSVRNKKPIFINHLREEYHQYVDVMPSALEKEKIRDGKEPKSVIFSPLVIEEALIGILSVQSFRKSAYEQTDFEIVSILSSYMAIALNNSIQNTLLSDEIKEREGAEKKLKMLNHKLKKLSEIDELTGVYNRRHLMERISDEWYKASRTQSPLSLIILDVDKFKQYNDTYGHLAGDDCLKAVAQVLCQTTRREHDLVSRYGGDEFVVLLPYTDLKGACALAEEMRKGVMALQIPHINSEVSEEVTITLGVASIVPNFKEPYEILMAIADEALYKAKVKSRNVVVAMDERR